MAPPDASKRFPVSIATLLIGILIGLLFGRITLDARLCALLGAFGMHPAECRPDLKPDALAGGSGHPNFCKQVSVSPDAFIVVKNVGNETAAASSTLVEVYAQPVSSTHTLATPAIPAGGSHTLQLAVPVATIDFPIRVTVDSAGVVAETDENNNQMYGLCVR